MSEKCFVFEVFEKQFYSVKTVAENNNNNLAALTGIRSFLSSHFSHSYCQLSTVFNGHTTRQLFMPTGLDLSSV